MLAVAVGLFLVRRATREPLFQGRPLSAWADDLRSGDTSVRQHALEALQNSPEAVEFLSQRISAQPGPVGRAGNYIGRYLPDFVKRPFRRWYNPSRPLLEKHLAAQALQQIGTNAQAAVPALGKMLRDDNVLLISSAGMALGRIGPASLAVLLPALNDPNFNVRSSACAGLGELRSNAAPAVPRLCEIIEHESGPIVSVAAQTLTQIGAASIPGAAALLSSTNAAARRTGAFVLGVIGWDAQPAVPELIKAGSDENVQVRWMAVDALGKVSYSSRPAGEALANALTDSEATVRAAALSGLLNHPRFIRENVTRITTLLNDPSPLVRANAAQAIGRVGLNRTNQFSDAAGKDLHRAEQ